MSPAPDGPAPDGPAPDGPALSVLLVTDEGGLEPLAKTLRHLGRQTIAERIEIILVAPRGAEIDGDHPSLAPFWKMRLVEVAEVRSLSYARQPGIHAARAPVIAFAESHTYHAPHWAERLLEAHREPWVAVGPGVSNANPTYAASWANFLLDYGPWYHGRPRGEMDDLPGHNSAYKSEALAAYGPELVELLEQEAFLHADLRARGGRLLFEPAACMGHMNVTALRGWWSERVAAGQRYAGARSSSWPRWRRLLYAAGSPLIPLVRFIRLLPVWRLCARRERLPRWMAPALAFSLVASATGELLGYALGSGSSMWRLSRIELRKDRHLRRGEPLADPG